MLNEGIIVAGGNGKGSSLSQLSRPTGIIVDRWDNIYVSDSENHRVMCWCKEMNEGRIVVGGKKAGNETDQLNYPRGLSFDHQGKSLRC